MSWFAAIFVSAMGAYSVAFDGGGTAPAKPPAAAASLEPFTELIPGSTVKFDMVPVPAGVIDVDGKTVEIAPFWAAKAETTWDMYDIFVFKLDERSENAEADAVTRPSKPYISMDRGFGHTNYPAISVSHKGAMTFCEWLSKKTGRRYRLPTYAEWRYLCERAGIDASTLDAHAWYRENAEYKTHEVATKAPGAGGLVDLYGNAAEWVLVDGKEPRVVGGSYKDRVDAVGCGALLEPTLDWNASDPQIPQSVWWLADAGFIGFRVVCDPNE